MISVIGMRRAPCAQRGLTLIELLIASALGIIIVAALSQLFVDISRTNNEMAKTNSQIENARFAMQILEQDIVHAGFWDLHVPQFDDLSEVNSPTDVPADIPDPCLAYSSANWTQTFKDQLVGVPIQVTASTSAPGTCGGIVANPIVGTDLLVVRHAHTCEPGTTYCDDPGTTGQLYFQSSVCASDTKLYALDPNTPLTNKTCTPGTNAPRRRFVQSIYYIREWFSDTPSKDGIPTLVKSSFTYDPVGGTLAQRSAQAMVEGIEQFRVELGIDDVSETAAAADPNQPVNWVNADDWKTATNRGDGIPDRYVHCPSAGCDVSDLIHAVVAKIYILARANEPTLGYNDQKTYQLGSAAAPLGPFGDEYKRHVFSTTVRLNNISARRETP